MFPGLPAGGQVLELRHACQCVVGRAAGAPRSRAAGPGLDGTRGWNSRRSGRAHAPMSSSARLSLVSLQHRSSTSLDASDTAIMLLARAADEDCGKLVRPRLVRQRSRNWAAANAAVKIRAVVLGRPGEGRSTLPNRGQRFRARGESRLETLLPRGDLKTPGLSCSQHLQRRA
jgi:hypothetical protein